MGELHRLGQLLLLSYAIIGGSFLSQPAFAGEDDASDPTEQGVRDAQNKACDNRLAEPKKPRRTKTTAKTLPSANAAPKLTDAPMPSYTPATARAWTLRSFLEDDLEKNMALQHPFTIANAAEKVYALVTHRPARTAIDPIYRVKPVKIYPMLAGEDPASGGRLVVGQEEPVHTFVQFLYSAARGDRLGDAVGFPGPAGTGKTELFYVIDQLTRNLSQLPQYKQFSYRFKNLYDIPKLRKLHSFVKNEKGDLEPVDQYFNPDMPRSPFTLLRPKTQKRVLDRMPSLVRGKWNILISRGWSEPEPKTAEIIQRIFESKFPEIEQGLMSLDDIPEDVYISTLMDYVVIVPKEVVRPAFLEAKVIDPESENPDLGALYTTVDVARYPVFGLDSALSIRYTGDIFQQDGGLLMYDEFFRNDEGLLNRNLDTLQNQMAKGTVGRRVHLDILPVFNSNDESIEKAKEMGAIKALLDRTDRPPMRSLLHPNQIEAVIPFQVGANMFRMRSLDDTQGTLETEPFVHSEVYPAADEFGETKTAQGRYALYYKIEGVEYLIAPWTLNYMSWVAAATRVVTDENKIKNYKDSLTLVGANREVMHDPISRVKTMIGETTVEPAQRGELYRMRNMLKEGAGGVSSRDVKKWMKEVITLAHEKGTRVITPRLVNQAFVDMLESDRIMPESDKLRIHWGLIRKEVAERMLLPKLWSDVRTITSSEGNKAERIYDSIVDEMLRIAAGEGADPGKLGVNVPRLELVKALYRKRSGGRDFNVALITRIMKENNPNSNRRHPELLGAVREMLAEQERVTSDYIAGMDRFIRGADDDPMMRQKMAEISENLSAYGYDRASFEDAVMLVAQLNEDIDRQKLNGPRQ